MPQESQPVSPGLEALLHTAAFAPIQDLGWLRITGSDRVRWLNGMATNNIAALTPGHGNYNFFLNAQGRIQADATAWLLEDSILLETASPASLAALLDHFIIMDDVELEILPTRAGLLLAGPTAAALLTALNLTAPPANSLTPLPWESQPVDLLHPHSPLTPRYELWSDPATIGLLTETLRHAGATPATPTDLEHLRILAGTPLYDTDIRNTDTARDLPQETNQPHALHFAKGCYLGQEIVERIRSRGAVHRTFTGFTLTPDPASDLPAPGTLLTLENKTIGELTSIASIPLPTGTRQMALGYIRREVLDRAASTGIQYPGGVAIPTALPFSTT